MKLPPDFTQVTSTNIFQNQNPRATIKVTNHKFMNDLLTSEFTFILFFFYSDENSETEKAFEIVMINCIAKRP